MRGSSWCLQNLSRDVRYLCRRALQGLVPRPSLGGALDSNLRQYRERRAQMAHSQNTAHVGPPRTNGRSLTPSRLLCRVDKGCSSSSPSTSPRVSTNFDQGEWGSRRAQRAQVSPKSPISPFAPMAPCARPQSVHHVLTAFPHSSARSARSKPSPGPSCAPLIRRLLCRQDCSTSTGPRSSCTWSWPLILAARTIYSSRAFAWCAGFCALRPFCMSVLRLQCSSYVVDGAAGDIGRVRVHMWMSCQVTLMMVACCTMIGWVRGVKDPG